MPPRFLLATALLPLLAGACAAPGVDRPPALPTVAARCSNDGLIHAEVSGAVSRHVAALVTPTLDGARLREAARLTLPCGFALDTRWLQHLIVTDGTETRQYVENNPFGFAVPFGFSERVSRPYTLRALPESYRLTPKTCAQDLGRPPEAGPLCSAFASSMMVAEAEPAGGHRLRHYRMRDSAWQPGFDAAVIGAEIAALYWITLPDAPGGTVTLYLRDAAGLYRVFLDVPQG
ncbi:hypothetical protein PK98_15335 [Croceibacterium mercuriale]|uniref:Uncharacterized protein n=1 Tax=Croceibacterium mercuriale TaxID=1572751 RepID=A0A0B2BRI5_9SPHN|nr:hypothetical protein [Croceibacterium mercuriale]KHL24145.1 hypothetical protein PK98_15335 [Croceibacterium mercuriale]